MNKIIELIDGLKTILGVLLIIASFFLSQYGETLRGAGFFLIGYGGKEKQLKYKQGGIKKAVEIKALKWRKHEN